MKTIKYFAYGSNMDPERMKTRGVHFTLRKRAILPSWSLVFNKIAHKPGAGYANIIQKDNDVVEGILYEIDENGLRELDLHEGYPYHYNRITIQVQTDEGMVEAETYIANPAKTEDGLKPTKEYLNHLMKGADILSEDYRKKLLNIETID